MIEQNLSKRERIDPTKPGASILSRAGRDEPIPATRGGRIGDGSRGDGQAADTRAARGQAILEMQVDEALRATGHLPLRYLEFTEDGGVVTLRGRLPSYYLKQIAQTVVLAIPGVDGVCDELDVVSLR